MSTETPIQWATTVPGSYVPEKTRISFEGQGERVAEVSADGAVTYLDMDRMRAVLAKPFDQRNVVHITATLVLEAHRRGMADARSVLTALEHARDYISTGGEPQPAVLGDVLSAIEMLQQPAAASGAAPQLSDEQIIEIARQQDVPHGIPALDRPILRLVRAALAAAQAAPAAAPAELQCLCGAVWSHNRQHGWTLEHLGGKPSGPRWRHKRTGGTYIELYRGRLQAAANLDMAPVVVYRSEADGHVWVRPVAEFEDGRFDPISGAAAPADTTAAQEQQHG